MRRCKRGHKWIAEELEEYAKAVRGIGRNYEPLRGPAGGDAIPLGGFLTHQSERPEHLEVSPHGWVAGVTQLAQLCDCRCLQATKAA